MLKLILQLVITVFGFSFAQAQKTNLQVEKKVFPNGMTVLVHAKNDVPIVSVYSWFKVGSKDEVLGKTGLAHFFEHLMFSGTQKYPLSQFESLMEQKGINYNAFTNQDSTVYYEQLPSSELEFILDFESDRLLNLEITKEKFDSEKKIILEEKLKRLDDSVEGSLNAMLFENLFNKHPYKYPVIGLVADIKKLTLTDAIEFFKKHYRSENLVLSIAGDVDAKNVFKLVEKYYSSLPSSSVKENRIYKDEELIESKSLALNREVENQKISIAYKIGKLGDRESYVLDLLSHVLAGDKSSRLYKKLVLKDNLAQQVSVSSYNLLESGIFEIDVYIKESTSKQKILNIIDQEMSDIFVNSISQAELERAKLNMLKDTLVSLRGVNTRARLLALNEALLGDYKRLFTDLDLYQTITIAEIKQAAMTRFKNKQRIILELVKK